MSNVRISINFQPPLYVDLLKAVIQSLGKIEFVEWPKESGDGCQAENVAQEKPDLIISSLEWRKYESLEPQVRPKTTTKWIAFSPHGDLGYTRAAGSETWIKVSPFGMTQLIEEIRKEL